MYIQKIRALKKEAITMRPETTNGIQMLGNGLETILNPDKFQMALNKVCEAAFAAVFQAQDEGKLQWKRTGDELTDLSSEAIVKNGRSQEITIPVLFYINCMSGYLMLGSRKNSPCRNTADPRVRRLYTQVTGKVLQ